MHYIMFDVESCLGLLNVETLGQTIFLDSQSFLDWDLWANSIVIFCPEDVKYIMPLLRPK